MKVVGLVHNFFSKPRHIYNGYKYKFQYINNFYSIENIILFLLVFFSTYKRSILIETHLCLFIN